MPTTVCMTMLMMPESWHKSPISHINHLNVYIHGADDGKVPETSNNAVPNSYLIIKSKFSAHPTQLLHR